MVILPVVGAWVLVATLRAGLAHQRLARLAWLDGAELDVDALPDAVGRDPARCRR